MAKTKGNPGYRRRLSIGSGGNWAKLGLKLGVETVPGLEPREDPVKELHPDPESDQKQNGPWRADLYRESRLYW